MTTEEAIKELREASDNEVRYGDTEHHYDEVMKRVEAFDMAIKALEFVEGCEVEDGLYEACKTAIKALEIQRLANGEKIFNVLPLEQEPRWIPVSERLPEEEGNYLVCYNNGYISVSEWHPNPYEKVCFDLLPDLIVAWMPLPKSYVTDINVGKITESEE